MVPHHWLTHAFEEIYFTQPDHCVSESVRLICAYVDLRFFFPFPFCCTTMLVCVKTCVSPTSQMFACFCVCLSDHPPACTALHLLCLAHFKLTLEIWGTYCTESQKEGEKKFGSCCVCFLHFGVILCVELYMCLYVCLWMCGWELSALPASVRMNQCIGVVGQKNIGGSSK